MVHPVVFIFTKEGCPACIMTMKNYEALERDIKNMSPECEIRVISYGSDWKTRIYDVKEYKNIKNLDLTKPGLNISTLTFAPMFAISRSDQTHILEKVKVNGAKYQSKQRIFLQSNTEKPEKIRTWLTRNLKEINDEIKNGAHRSNINLNHIKDNNIDIELEKKKAVIALNNAKKKEKKNNKPGTNRKYYFEMVSLD